MSASSSVREVAQAAYTAATGKTLPGDGSPSKKTKKLPVGPHGRHGSKRNYISNLHCLFSSSFSSFSSIVGLCIRLRLCTSSSTSTLAGLFPYSHPPSHHLTIPSLFTCICLARPGKKKGVVWHHNHRLYKYIYSPPSTYCFLRLSYTYTRAHTYIPASCFQQVCLLYPRLRNRGRELERQA